ncbi:MAG: TlpA family protein disulfide reductase [Jatrophihabitantaceae bacterium]
MESGWIAFAIATWLVLLLNLALTLRTVQWLRSRQRAEQLDAIRESLPELALGAPAPDFRVRDLDGQPVRLADYRGRETAFVFVSPHCGPCARELPDLAKLAGQAKASASAELVLVSDSSTPETHAWLSAIAERHPEVSGSRLLVAGGTRSDFLALYNPRGLTPYFLHLDADGRVTARGGLRSPYWAAIVKRWETGANPMRTLRRYV